MEGLDEVTGAVLRFIAACSRDDAGPEPARDDAEFDRLVRRIFAFQVAASPAYRAFCERRGVRAEAVAGWRDVPAVPTAAFKELDLACGPAERIFRTSGTTRGGERRGRHLVPRLELYRASALAHFRRMVLPDAATPRLVAVLGGPELLADSSLVQMVEWIRADLCGGDGEYLVDATGFDPERAAMRIEAAAADGKPLCLIGLRVLLTSLLEHCRRHDRRPDLPADSRLVDTGGAKGGRALSDQGFLAACWQVLGVPGWACVNEYGMTELCSQFYDDVLVRRFAGSNAKRRKLGPSWTRTRAVDPETLAPVPDGTPGILCHVDLANAGSVLAVQTEDVGIVEGDRFLLLGRLAGAEPRGCALALSDILAANA
jgi:hypothetical protein